MNKSEYIFYYFGPHLFHTKLSPQFCNELFERGNKKDLKNCKEMLAGHFDSEYYFRQEDADFFVNHLVNSGVYDNFKKSTNHFYNFDPKLDFDNLNLESLWINFMNSGDFNPIHTHENDLSFVLFLKVPKEIKKENEEYKKHGGTDKSSGPGCLIFSWGEPQEGFIHTKSVLPEEGDFFIFPAKLRHIVYPYKSNVERVTAAGNFSFTNGQIKKFT